MDAIRKFLRVAYPGKQLKIVDALSNGHSQLMGIHDAGKMFAGLLAASAFFQQIIIASKKNPVQRRGPIEKFGIVFTGSPVLLSRQHVHATPTKTLGNGTRNVFIHV